MRFRDFFSSAPKPNPSPARARLADAERELKSTTNERAQIALAEEIAQLQAAVAFDDLIARVPEGSLLAAARDQLNALNQILATERDLIAGAAMTIELAIHHGAEIYNKGSHIGCACIYDHAARMILRLIKGGAGSQPEVRVVARRLIQVSFDPITPAVANQRAWQLRHAFDDILVLAQTNVEPPVVAKPAASARILISYRREDATPYARLLHGKLQSVFGDHVFLDLDGIWGGEDFLDRLKHEIEKCDAVVAVISRGWLGVATDGSRRIDKADDFVRAEVEGALLRGVRVVPALVGGASMPDTKDLPESLRPLAQKQFIEITDQRLDYDIDRLVTALKKTLPAPG